MLGNLFPQRAGPGPPILTILAPAARRNRGVSRVLNDVGPPVEATSATRPSVFENTLPDSAKTLAKAAIKFGSRTERD